MRHHAIALCVGLILAVFFSYFASSASWDLLATGHKAETTGFSRFNGYFDAQGDGMLEGRLDVPCAAIGSEAWIYDGKCYGYFGISPAVLRVPLNAVFPSMRGQWTPVLVLVAALVNLFSAYVLLRQARRALGQKTVLSGFDTAAASIFLIAVGVGSTNLFLLNEPNVYHEALLWGGAFALLSYSALIRFLERHGTGALLVALLFGCLAINARPLNGSGPVFAAIAVIFLAFIHEFAGKGRFGARLSAISAAFVPPETRFRVSPVSRGLGLALALAVLASPFLVLYLKFGEPLADLGHNVLIRQDPLRLARTDGAQANFGNIPFHLAYYFGPLATSLSTDFPWVTMVLPDWSALARFPDAKIDWLEPRVHPLLTMPLFFAFGSLGLWASMKGGAGLLPFRSAMAGSLAAGGLVLVAVSGSQRYIHDVFPFFVLSAAVGVAFASSFTRRAARFGALAALVVLAGLGIHVNLVSVYQSHFTSLHVKNDIADGLVALREMPYRDAEIRRLHPDLLRRARDTEDAAAQYALALLYDNFARDHDAAMRWYEASALGGFAGAQFRLGLHYMHGRVRRPHETPQTKALAWAWLELAARQGHPDAARARDSLYSRMNDLVRYRAEMLVAVLSESVQRK